MDRIKVERAIAGLMEWRKHVQTNSDIDSDISTAIEALKAQLLQGTTSDLISRQAAIDALDCINGTEEVLRSLPPAQPEPHWIPCSERMPEEHEWIGTKKFGTTISDEVYVTFENEKGERFCKHMHFQNGELSRYDQSHIDTWFKGSKPIAWMSLPEAYKSNK